MGKQEKKKYLTISDCFKREQTCLYTPFEALFRLLTVLRVVSRTFQIFRQPCALASAQAAFLCISIFIFIVRVAF